MAFVNFISCELRKTTFPFFPQGRKSDKQSPGYSSCRFVACHMKRLSLVLVLAIFQCTVSALAQDHGRIKKKPPTPAETERIVSDMVMNDSLLRTGDIVATDRGFFVFRGLAPDGISNDFVPVPNPVPSGRK